MSVPIYVDAHSGYKASERPRQFVLDERTYEIVTVEDQWYSPDALFFKVRTADGKRYVLRYDEREDEWTLQSGLDGNELLARPGIEIIAVDPAIIRRAEQQIESCDHCHPGDADVPFDWVLAEVMDKPGMVEFVLTEPARCPNCKRPISEKTPVEVKDGD